MSSARRIYVSAVHEEFPETLEMLRSTLEELGCQMVTLEACPPYWRTLDKRIRERLPTCDTLLHVIGERCGRCPDVPTVPKGQTRRSIAQMEHEIGTELSTTGKRTPSSVHVFLSGDAHTVPAGLKPEDHAQAQMQAQHRASLQAAGGTHPLPEDGMAWKMWLVKELGLVDPNAQAAAPINLPPPSIAFRPAKQEAKPASSGMSPVAIGVIVVGILVVGLGLLQTLKEKKPADTSHAGAKVVATAFDPAAAHQVLQSYVSTYRDWIRDTVDIPVMYLDHWTRLSLSARTKLSEAQVKSFLEQAVTQDIGPAFTVEDRLSALLAAGKYQTAMDFALVHQATLSAEGFEIAANAAASRFDQTVSTSHEDRAIRFYRSAVEKTDAQKEPMNWGRRQSALAAMLDTQGLKSEAHTASEAAVSTLEKVADQAPLELAYARLLLAQNLHGAKAVELGKKAVALFDQDPHKDAALNLTALSMLATVYLHEAMDPRNANDAALCANYTSEAVLLFRKSMTEAEQKLGPVHPITGYHLFRLGATFALRSKPDTPPAEGTGSVAENLGEVFLKSQLTEAETYLQRALAIREAGYGSNHLNTANALTGIGQLLFKQGRFPEAESMYRRALASALEHLGTRHPKLSAFKISLADCLVKTGKTEEAEKFLREALQEMESFGVASGEDMCYAHLRAANVFHDLKKYSEMSRHMEKALSHAPEKNVELRAMATVGLYRANILDQRLGEARLASEKALPLMLRTPFYLTKENFSLISVMRTHAVWKQQLGDPPSELKTRYQTMFRDAGVSSDYFEQIWSKVSQ